MTKRGWQPSMGGERMKNPANPRLREVIQDPGHEFYACVSQIWDESENLVMESHFGRIIEVVRGEDGVLRRNPWPTTPTIAGIVSEDEMRQRRARLDIESRRDAVWASAYAHALSLISTPQRTQDGALSWSTVGMEQLRYARAWADFAVQSLKRQ